MKGEVLGYCVLSAVVLIWVLSGFFIQFLFTESGYDHPAAMTVFSVGLCALLLLIPQKHEPAPTKVLLLERPVTSKTVVKQRVVLGLAWLSGQLLYNVSLKHMSVSSNTAVSSASSLFTFLFSLALLPGYAVTLPAVLALLCSSMGIFLIASLDDGGLTASPGGVLLAVAGCACYGFFTTMLKRFSRNDEEESVITLFGHLGLVTCIVGPFVVLVADRSGVDPFALPSSVRPVLGMLTNALIGSVLSDVLLAKTVLLLNPITVSLGLSFTMPVSLLIDSAVGAKPFHLTYLAAMALQFTSVGLISYDNHVNNRV